MPIDDEVGDDESTIAWLSFYNNKQRKEKNSLKRKKLNQKG